MYPLTLGFLIPGRQLRDEVKACLTGLPVRTVLEESEVAGFVEMSSRLRPDALLIDVSGLTPPLGEVVAQVRAGGSNPMIVVLSASADPEMILAALRAGANEYIYPPIGENLRRALERGADERSRRPESGNPAGRTLGFVSAKGGCGATTVACHVAVELGRLGRGKHTLLADFDLQVGMVNFLMKTQSPYSIMDAVNNLHRLDTSYWKALVSNGIPGLEVIAAPPGRPSLPLPQTEPLRHVAAFARSQYDWVVADLGRGLTAQALAVVEEMDETYLVTTPDVPALHQVQHIVQTLAEVGYYKDRIRVVLNRVPARSDLTAPELEKMLGVQVVAELHDDYGALYECYCSGKLLPAGSNLARQIARLALKVSGLPPEKPKKRFSLFG